MIHPAVDADPLDTEVSIECDCGRTITAQLREVKEGTLVPCKCGAFVGPDFDDLVMDLEDIELKLARGFSSLRRAMHTGVAPNEAPVV